MAKKVTQIWAILSIVSVKVRYIIKISSRNEVYTYYKWVIWKITERRYWRRRR